MKPGRQRFITLYQYRHLTLDQIARQYRTSRAEVIKWRREYGVRGRVNPVTNQTCFHSSGKDELCPFVKRCLVLAAAHGPLACEVLFDWEGNAVPKTQDWIERVLKLDPTLRSLLSGLIIVAKGGGPPFLTFVWISQYHKEQGQRRERTLRRHLGGLSKVRIVHQTQSEYVRGDPMAEEIVLLGGRTKENA